MTCTTTTLTGRNGKFVVDDTLVARVTKWSVNPKVGENTWGDSDSGGFTNRTSGRRDCTFDAEGKYDSSDEVWDLFQPGDCAEAVLWMNATTLYWAFPQALCSDFKVEIDVDGEAVVGFTSTWGADGAFYFPGESGAPSHSLPS